MSDGRSDRRDGAPAPVRHRLDPLGLTTRGEGIITGTVVCAAAMAATAGHLTSTAQVTLAIVGTVFVYWLAHLHAVALGYAMSGGHHPVVAVRHGLAHTWPIPAVSLLPIGVLVLAELAGTSLRNATWIALYTTVGLLAAYSFHAARRGGLGTWGSIAAAAAGAGLGILIALLKASLH